MEVVGWLETVLVVSVAASRVLCFEEHVASVAVAENVGRVASPADVAEMVRNARPVDRDFAREGVLGAPIESSVEFCRCEGVAAVEDLDLVGLVDDPVEIGPGGG